MDTGFIRGRGDRVGHLLRLSRGGDVRLLGSHSPDGERYRVHAGASCIVRGHGMRFSAIDRHTFRQLLTGNCYVERLRPQWFAAFHDSSHRIGCFRDSTSAQPSYLEPSQILLA